VLLTRVNSIANFEARVKMFSAIFLRKR